MQKITPFLWFDTQAEEAVNFYVSIFKDSQIDKVTHYDQAGAKASGMPEGTVMTMSFKLAGQEFVALNGGTYFTFSPGVSFYISCESETELDLLWSKLSTEGSVLMPLDQYPFSRKYGWLQDKYGVSWQLNLVEQLQQKITPCLLFTGNQHGKAEEAIEFYSKIFKDSVTLMAARYEPGEGGQEGTLKHAEFKLVGQLFIAMDSNLDHKFSLNQAISFVVNCENQQEVDYFWEELSKGGSTNQCGWLQDRFGLPWQIVPVALAEMLNDPDPGKAKRVMEAMLKMNKIDLEILKHSYEQ